MVSVLCCSSFSQYDSYVRPTWTVPAEACAAEITPTNMDKDVYNSYHAGGNQTGSAVPFLRDAVRADESR